MSIKHVRVTASALRLTLGRVAIGYIVGTTKSKDTASGAIQPQLARVDVYDSKSGRLVQQVWSDPASGVYRASGLLAGHAYNVVATDPGGQYQLVGSSGLVAAEATL